MAGNTKIVETEEPKVDFVPTVDAQEEYGPYRNYTRAQTPHGIYGVPRGKIMWFELDDYYNKKEHEWQKRWMPHYRDVNIDPSDTRPGVPLKQKSDKENAANVAAYHERLEGRKAAAVTQREEAEK